MITNWIDTHWAILVMIFYITIMWPFDYHIDGEVIWFDNQIIYVRGGNKIFYEF